MFIVICFGIVEKREEGTKREEKAYDFGSNFMVVEKAREKDG